MPSRRRAEYDDDLLAELIAGGKLSLKEIAGRLGISHTTVSRIARGKVRADLQPRIHAAMQQSVREARKPAARSGHQEVQGPLARPGGRKKQYDEQVLVDLLARGDLSYAKIAEELGVSTTLVAKIARGEARADLQPRIRAAVDCFRKEAGRLGARWLKHLVTKHIRDGLEGSSEMARKCREYAMDRFFKAQDEDADGTAGVSPPDLTNLSAETKSRVLKELGGPTD